MPRASLNPQKAVDTHRFFARRQPIKWSCNRCHRKYAANSNGYLIGPFPINRKKWMLVCKACTDYYQTEEGTQEIVLRKMGIRPQKKQEGTEWDI